MLSGQNSAKQAYKIWRKKISGAIK